MWTSMSNDVTSRVPGVLTRSMYSRLLRKVLSHTLVLFLNQTLGNPPMQLAKLVS